ncbi:MAG: GtrA family protein [Candidatus Melainabacteria bacterium]|nr:GtrA family protein [Candidatus Melainabacteria bacterium]
MNRTNDARALSDLSRTRRQLGRFLVVGSLAVAVDALVYQALWILLQQSVWASDVSAWLGWAKAVSFLSGSGVAFVFNKRWTFASTLPASTPPANTFPEKTLERSSCGAVNTELPRRADVGPAKAQALRFMALYLFSLAANVAVNKCCIGLLSTGLWPAFLLATATSTILNFLGQKFWVFPQACSAYYGFQPVETPPFSTERRMPVPRHNQSFAHPGDPNS